MILLIDNYDSFTYNLLQQVGSLYPKIQVARNDKISLQEIAKTKPKLIILSPGPGRPENAGICVPLIQHFYQDIPIIGICLGHQAIAKAFGGEVIAANEIVHGKQSAIFHHGKDIFKYLPRAFSAARYHSLVVAEKNIPPSLEVLAESTNGLIMAMKHRDFPIYGLQFHPESILTPLGNKLMRHLLQTCLGASLC